jgi:cell division protease FtsH
LAAFTCQEVWFLNPFYKNLALWCRDHHDDGHALQNVQRPEMVESTLGYSEFLTMVDDNRIEEVVIQGQDLSATDIGGRKYRVYAPQDPDLVKNLREKTSASKPGRRPIRPGTTS